VSTRFGKPGRPCAGFFFALKNILKNFHMALNAARQLVVLYL